MNVTRKDLEKGQIELLVEVSVEELEPLMEKGAENISKEMKIEGFRPGKAPLNIVKQKVGEAVILEEAVRHYVHKKTNAIIDEHVKDKQVVGQPEVEVLKMAPGNPLEYKIKLAILPETKLGDYKDLGVKIDKIKVEEKEITKVLNDLAEMRAKEVISNEAIKDGDKVLARVNLFLDKVPVEDGQSPELHIIIGKNYLVEGFDKEIIGLKKADTKEFSLVYPSNHYQKHLAGKKVEFKVEIKEVYNREIPKIDDEMAKVYQYKDLGQLKENMEKTIANQKKVEMSQKAEIEMLDKLVANASFGDIPEVLIKNESASMMREIEQGVVSQGGTFEDYLKSLNKTQDELMLELLPNADKRVKSALVLKEIAKAENINASESEIDTELNKMKERYSKDEKALEALSSPHYRSYIENMILNQKSMKMLKDSNITDENIVDKQKS